MKSTQIKKLREKLGMSQTEFAQELGIRQATVSDWELDRVEPSPMAKKLLAMLEKHGKK